MDCDSPPPPPDSAGFGGLAALLAARPERRDAALRGGVDLQRCATARREAVAALRARSEEQRRRERRGGMPPSSPSVPHPGALPLPSPRLGDQSPARAAAVAPASAPAAATTAARRFLSSTELRELGLRPCVPMYGMLAFQGLSPRKWVATAVRPAIAPRLTLWRTLSPTGPLRTLPRVTHLRVGLAGPLAPGRVMLVRRPRTALGAYRGGCARCGSGLPPRMQTLSTVPLAPPPLGRRRPPGRLAARGSAVSSAPSRSARVVIGRGRPPPRLAGGTRPWPVFPGPRAWPTPFSRWRASGLSRLLRRKTLGRLGPARSLLLTRPPPPSWHPRFPGVGVLPTLRVARRSAPGQCLHPRGAALGCFLGLPWASACKPRPAISLPSPRYLTRGRTAAIPSASLTAVPCPCTRRTSRCSRPPAYTALSLAARRAMLALGTDGSPLRPSKGTWMPRTARGLRNGRSPKHGFATTGACSAQSVGSCAASRVSAAAAAGLRGALLLPLLAVPPTRMIPWGSSPR